MDPITIALSLAKFAPSLIRLITGSDKAADVADKVIDVAKAVTGTGTGEAALAAVQFDPAKAMEFQLAVGAQQLDWERMYLADVANARAMQIAALSQEDKFSKRFVYYFAAGWSLFTMLYVSGITFWPPMSEAGKSNSATVLGFLLGTAVSMIFGYFYGSNKTSQVKDATISKLVA
jgi:hypothetical protein